MKSFKHLLAITIALLPSAALADQFTPEQMVDVMTKSPSNRDVRVRDADFDVPWGIIAHDPVTHVMPLKVLPLTNR